MRVGTPNFVPERLRQAREGRGLTAVSLSQLVEVTPSAISHYEHGRQTPAPEILERLGRVLNCPTQFFLRPTKPETSVVYWRSMASATKASRVKSIRRFEWLKETVTYLRQFLDLPPPNLPDIPAPSDVRALDADAIEEAAQICRDHWRLGAGPIVNVVRILEANGVIMSRTDLEAEKQDAYSCWPEGDAPYVVLSSMKASAVRSRFDAAHELGHLILHRSVAPEAWASTATRKLIEAQAHRFAGAFLLPEESFTYDVWAPTLDAFRTLKEHWKVAIQAMVMRCEHLGLLSEDQVTRMWINISRRGWRRREPLDDTLPPEEPSTLRRAFEVLISERIRTASQIDAELVLPSGDVEELCGLPHGFLREAFVGGGPEPKIKLHQGKGSRVVEFPER